MDIDRLRAAYPTHTLVWAGDFNQTLSGPNYGGTARNREALAKALRERGLVAWNANAAHAKDGMHAIDLICGPADLTVAAQGRIAPASEGVTLSDHAGYWVHVESVP